jgi:hypothetical protein
MSQIGSRNTGRLTKITVTTGGTGYTSPPTVIVAGGTGVTAYAHLSGGQVETVVVASGGSGFTGAATVSFAGGGGTGAAATAYAHTGPPRPMTFFKGRYNDVYGVDGMGRGIRWDGDSATVEAIGINKPARGPTCAAFTTGASGFVKSVQIVNGGAGYNNVPTVAFSGGTPTTPATAVANISDGRVSRIRITDPGSGYQATPSVSIAGGIASGASFSVGISGRVESVAIAAGGAGYTSSATTSPSVVFSTAQGLTGANAVASVDTLGRISSIQILAAGTGATTAGVTASIVGGGGTGASLSVDMLYSVASVTVTSGGTGYMVPPIITIAPAVSDATGSGAGVTASVDGSGAVAAVAVFAGGEYQDRPSAIILDTTAQAMATMGQRLRGTYKCCIRYIDDTAGEPIPSSISELVEVDAGDASGGIAWSFAHHGLDDRVSAMELWRTTANQDVILFRVATIQRTDEAFTGSYTDTLGDDELKDATRGGYGLMPITLPSGQINARRFAPPPPEFAVAVMFQDRAWYAVDTSGERRNSLMYSEIDEPESVPESNELVVQENTGTPDKIVALVPLASELLVVQQSHTYKLNYVAQPVIDASIVLGAYRGVLNSRCWAVMGGVAFLVDTHGMYAYDGSSEEAVSAPVDNLWRDGVIDFSKADQFHVTADMSTRTVRFFYCQSSDAKPSRAMCYCVATKAWWEESYAEPVTAACQAMVGTRMQNLHGTSGGGFVKFTGLSDGGTPVQYQFRSGNFSITDKDGSRSLAVVYQPTEQDANLGVRLHYNNAAAPRANAIATDRGSGFVTIAGSTEATLNMKRTRSSLGDANGYAAAYYSGHLDPRSSGGDRHVAVAFGGEQASDAVIIHRIGMEGAE